VASDGRSGEMQHGSYVASCSKFEDMERIWFDLRNCVFQINADNDKEVACLSTPSRIS